MKKIILVFGVIAGSILAGMMFITAPLYSEGTLGMDAGELIGYTTMIVAFLTIFFGIKSYRDNHAHGKISFGKGFQIGILIVLIGSLMYASAWEVVYHNYFPDFEDKYRAGVLQKMHEAGASDEELALKKQELDSFAVTYKNPFLRFGMTFLIEVFPVGFVITLASAWILKRKEILSNTNQYE